MLEALLATIIRPCLGQGSSKASPLPRDEANELFGTLRAEEILAINTAFREQLRVSRGWSPDPLASSLDRLHDGSYPQSGSSPG